MTLVRYLSALLPLITIVLLALAVALPWGVPANYAFVLPLIVFMAIHYWTWERAKFVPTWIAFISGLLVDFLTNGPLGYWALLFLFGHAIALNLRVTGEMWSFLASWLVFALNVAILSACGWAIASAYFARVAEWKAMVEGAVYAIIFFPVAALLLGGINQMIVDGGKVWYGARRQ